ncbi:MAG: FapA family protein [Candidatus Cloacimonetes bacterium]|nr:FapA family protein [Candidatus Cloacimonadota bacterium]
MVKSKQTYSSSDGSVKIRVHADGSKADILLNEDVNLINSNALEELLKEAEIVYGFENAIEFCKKEKIERERGEYFPLALADNTSWEAEVEIIIEPLECLLSPRLFSLNDLSRVRYITTGEKLAKVKTGDGSGGQNKNIFGRKIKDLASDKNFLDTFLGTNVEFDTRRNLIIASGNGYALVENGKRISVTDNIFLQQDIIDGDYEIKSGLTLEGSLFGSSLNVGGNLKVQGKVENCSEKGIIASGNIELDSADNSLLICKGNLEFSNLLLNCQVFADGYIKGTERSSISGGELQAGRYIEAATIGSESGEETIAEIGISPYLKALMILISRSLRQSNWNYKEPDNTEPLVRDLKEMEMKYLKALPDFLSLHREEKKITGYIDILPPTRLRIFHLTRLINNEGEPLTFELVHSESN